jgi:hypothetical protein
MTKAQAQCGTSTVTNEDRFIPLTPENEEVSGPSTTEYDRGHSDTSEDERTGPSEMRGSSGYSPVSDVEPEQQKVKIVCPGAQAPSIGDVVDPVPWTSCSPHQSATSETEVEVAIEEHRSTS